MYECEKCGETVDQLFQPRGALWEICGDCLKEEADLDEAGDTN